MPRLSAIHCEPLQALLDQQRFTPRDTLLRDIARAEQLASEIRPEVEYPEDWIAYRITAYRPDLDAPALVPGRALLSDLSALVEHLCEAAQLCADDLPVDAFSIESLASRWRVARKTIERYRRRGLVARRWRDPAGLARLAFAPNVVAAFERTHQSLLQRAGAFSRIDDQEADALAQSAARALAAAPNATMTGLVDTLAQQSGRSAPAVRRVLDETGPSIPGVTAPKRGAPHLSRGIERRIARAVAFGIRPGLIAERYGCTRLTVHRVAVREQARQLKRLCATLPSGDDGLDVDVLDHPIVAHAPPISPILDPRQLADAVATDPPADAPEERALMTGHRALLERAAAVGHGIDPARPNQRLCDRALTDLRWALRLRARAIEMQRSLILRTIESRTGLSWHHLASAAAVQLHLVATRAATDAIARFDPRRGGRLAAPVSIAANRALAGIVQELTLARPLRSAQQRFVLASPLDHLASWQSSVEPHRHLPDIIGCLQDTDAALLAMRYALPPAAAPIHPRTITEVAQTFGVTPARIIGAERRARRAIRTRLA
ncbi:MAG: hypothetical protein KDA20_02115 [Phycisphaerales bacterium]|nr:hypothetical protein [Phycisphaerales bacterium]